MVKVPGGVWKRHVDQLLKDDTQIAGKSESDDTEISSETSTSPVTERNYQKHLMDREALRTLLRVPVVMIPQSGTTIAIQMFPNPPQVMQKRLEDVILYE